MWGGDVAEGLIVIAGRGRENKTYYVGHRQPQTFWKLVCGMRGVLASDMELVFGEYPDTAPVDYSLIDVDTLYHDTGYEPGRPLREGIMRTAEWVRKYKTI